MRHGIYILFSSVLALSVAGPMTPTVAVAQSKKDIAEAKKRFRAGKKLYEDEKYAEAAAAFFEAYELSDRAELLYNVGQSHRLAGNLQEAEKFLQRYLEAAPDAPNAEDVVEMVVEIQQEIAAQLATVQIETKVAGREVFVGDELEPRCATPCSITVQPGAQAVTLRGDQMADYVEELALEKGQTFQLKIELQPAVQFGYLLLTTDRPGGTLRVGGVEAGLPLQSPLELEAGDYSVTVESARRTKWTGQISVEPEETTELLVPMQSLVEARKRGSLRKSLAYGFWGVSAASAVGAVLMGMQARAAWDELATQEASRGFVDEGLRQQGMNQQGVANLMWAIAGGAVVTGIGLFVWDEFAAEKDPQPARPTPTETAQSE